METIDDALARTLDDTALIEAARSRLQECDDVLEDRLRDEIGGLPVSVEDDPDADVDGVNISNVRFDPKEFELMEVRNSSALLSGVMTVHVEVFATVADYDNGSRDEGDWVFLPYNSVTYSNDVNARVVVRIPLEDAAPLELGGIDSVSVEEPRELDINHRWETTMRQDWSEDDEPDRNEPNESEEEKAQASK